MPSWTLIGYHAVEQKVFDQAVREESGCGEGLLRLCFTTWFSSPLSAISQTKKDSARKLGVCLSETVEPPNLKQKGAKRNPDQTVIDAALESPNYVVWRLQTTLNIADLVSKGKLEPGQNDKFNVLDGFRPFVAFGQPNTWQVDYVLLDRLPQNYEVRHVPIKLFHDQPNQAVIILFDSQKICDILDY